MVIPTANTPVLPPTLPMEATKKASSVGRPCLFIIKHTYDQWDYYLEFFWHKDQPTISIMTIIQGKEKYMNKDGYFDLGSNKVGFKKMSSAISFFDKKMSRLDILNEQLEY